MIWRSARDRQIGQKPNLVSALEITVPADLQGTGLSGKMLAAMRDNVKRLGFKDLVAPVRPNRKHLVPDMPIEAYAALVREDGMPQDPWLRVHVRAGSRIVATCKRAMVIPGTLDEWRSWTGQPFDESGPVVVPGALVPVQCSVEHDTRSTSSPRCGCTTSCEPGPGLTGRSARRSPHIPIVQQESLFGDKELGESAFRSRPAITAGLWPSREIRRYDAITGWAASLCLPHRIADMHCHWAQWAIPGTESSWDSCTFRSLCRWPSPVRTSTRTRLLPDSVTWPELAAVSGPRRG